MIVKLHGNSGSGKTTVARGLMDLATLVTPMGNPRRPDAYGLNIPKLTRPLYILGPYTNTCGGLDSIDTWKKAAELLHEYAVHGHVFYEGLLSSTYYGSFGKETERYNNDHIFAFMDTPLEVCIERVKARRLQAGNIKPFNEENTRDRQQPIDNVRKKVTHLGRPVVIINHAHDPVAQILALYS